MLAAAVREISKEDNVYVHLKKTDSLELLERINSNKLTNSNIAAVFVASHGEMTYWCRTEPGFCTKLRDPSLWDIRLRH